jgi:3-oxoacyl-[acyl-carrier-protein] synthase III
MPGISYIDYYIPKEELPIPRFLETIKPASIPPSFKDRQEYTAFIEGVLGLESLRVENNQDEASMIGGLIEKMFDTGKVKPEEIDIIMATQEPTHVTQPNLAKFLQYKYKMGNSYVINVTGNHCANIEVAIHLASSILMSRDDIRNILVISSNKTEVIENRIFGTYAVVGDAAGIMLLNNHNPMAAPLTPRLLDNVIISAGKLYDADVNSDNAIAHCISYVKCISDLINKRSLEDSQIERILIQNANALMVTQCIAAAGLDQKKIYSKNLGRYGHMDYVDFMINLKDMLAEGIANPERYMLSFGIGSAGSYVSCLFAFN